MAGTLILNSISPDVGTNLYLNATQGAGNVVIGNTTTALATFTNAGTLIVGNVIGSIANTNITGNITSSQITSVANTQITGTINSNQLGSNVAQFNGMKNRIINGAMVIDQRNAGASVAITTASPFITDRFFAYASQASKLTAQQNAGSVTPPVGFSNYLGFTSQSAYSITSTDIFTTAQRIEGFNTADLGWGTANAKTVTLSFQVYSSLTGTFGGSLQNSAQNRSYPFSFTISSANTWTAISITIAGDTTGTWIGATNGIGIQLNFSLGCGSTASGTAGSWSANSYWSVTGATSVVGTSGATFYITGVQLEVGSSATGFEYRQYGQELALCQRYYQKSYDIGTVPGTVTDVGITIGANAGNPANSSSWPDPIRFITSMRASPTISTWDRAGNISKFSYYQSGWSDNFGTITFISIGQNGAIYTQGATNGYNAAIHFAASSEL